MAELSIILLAYSSLAATVIGGILAFILYHFVPMKSRVEVMYGELYGRGDSDGAVTKMAETHQTIRDMLEESKRQQRRQRKAIEDIIDYLHDLVNAMDDDEDLPDPRNLPDPDEIFDNKGVDD